jgi:hypothetical protein
VPASSSGAGSSAAGQRRGCPASLLLIRVARLGQRLRSLQVTSPAAGLCGGPPGDSCRVTSPGTGLRCGGQECSWPSPNLLKSFGRAMASTSPGRSSSGSTRWSTRERQLAGSPVQPLAHTQAAHLRQAILPLSSYWSFGRAMASTPPGGRCSCRSSSSGRRPAASLRGGGLSLPLRVASPPRTKWGHSGSSGGAGSAAGRRVSTAGPAGATRSGRMARAAAGMRRVRQVGELTLPGYGALGGPPKTGLTGSAQQVPASPSRTSSIRRAGSAAGPQRCWQAGVLTLRAYAGGAAMVAGSLAPTTAARGPPGG